MLRYGLSQLKGLLHVVLLEAGISLFLETTVAANTFGCCPPKPLSCSF
jgi:hypothetical protein